MNMVRKVHSFAGAALALGRKLDDRAIGALATGVLAAGAKNNETITIAFFKPIS